MHYYQFNIGDYTSSTQHLEPMEDLAYRRMLDLYYSKELPLPNDIEKIARLIRMRTHTECIAIVLEEFFELKDDGYTNNGADKVLNKTYKKSESARKSAEARWSKNKGLGKRGDDANAMRTQCGNDADGMLPITQDPLPNTHNPIKEPIDSPKGKSSDYPEEFEWLWSNKPNREGGNPKKQAYSACKARLKSGSTWREMAEGLRRYSEYCQAKNIINTAMVQQMSTFFGTKESFKESWGVTNEGRNQHQAVCSESTDSYEMQKFRAAKARRYASRGRSVEALGNDGKDVLDLDSSQWSGAE